VKVKNHLELKRYCNLLSAQIDMKRIMEHLETLFWLNKADLVQLQLYRIKRMSAMTLKEIVWVIQRIYIMFCLYFCDDQYYDMKSDLVYKYC